MRIRLLVGTLLLTVATIAAFFVPSALALSSAERDAQVVELLGEAADAAAGVDAAGTGRLRPQTSTADDEHHYAVYDAAGKRLWGDGPNAADRPVVAALGGRSATDRSAGQRVAAVPLTGGRALRAAEPAAEADRATRASVARLGLIAVLILAGGSVAAWLLARRLTRPLRELGRSAARLGGGDFTATAASSTGVAEIDELADALNSSAARIGILVERERRLTADVSHQVRTPLTGLRLALEGELAAPRPDANEVLHEALGAVDRLEATVTSLTGLARDQVAAAPFDVDAAIAAAVRRWRPLFARAGRTVDAGAPSGAVSPTRRAAIDAILDVLADNALHHGAGRVTIAVDATRGTAAVSVVDEGSCVLADDQLFQRHHSAAGSTGIGLHLARTLAEAEGSRLRLVRRMPTTFQLLLPIDNGEPAAPGAVGPA